MPLFRLSIVVDVANADEAQFVLDRMVEQFEPVNMEGPEELAEDAAITEWRKDLVAKGFTPEQIEYLVEARQKIDNGAIVDLEDLQERLGYGVVDEAVLRDTFFKDEAVMRNPDGSRSIFDDVDK